MKSKLGKLPSFRELGLDGRILEYLDSEDLHTPTFIQYAFMTKYLSRPKPSYHLTSPTGSGKTLAYLLPIVHSIKQSQIAAGIALTKPLRPRALVLTLNKELVMQGNKVAKTISHFAKFKSAGIGIGKSMVEEQRCLENGVDVLFSTQSRIERMLHQRKAYLSCLQWLVIDEIDSLYQSQNYALSKFMDGIVKGAIEKHNTKIIVSGTTNPKGLQPYLSGFFGNMQSIVDQKTHLNLHNIKHEFIHCPTIDKHDPLINLLNRCRDRKVLVFCNSVKSLHELQYMLEEMGRSPLTLHSQLSKLKRIQNFQLFNNQQQKLLLSTDLGARGLDLKGLQVVINYDFPASVCDYLQRAGRTGRAGKKGTVYSLYHKSSIPIINELKGASFDQPLSIRESAYGFRYKQNRT